MKPDRLQGLIIIIIIATIFGGVISLALWGFGLTDRVLLLFALILLLVVVIGVLYEFDIGIPSIEVENRPLMLGVGLAFVAAAIIGLLFALIVSGILLPIVVFLAVWITVALLILQVYSEEGLTDLAVEEITERPTGNLEVLIENTGATTIDLTGATIRDTGSESIRPGIDRLEPGQTIEIVVPPHFGLEPRPMEYALGPLSIQMGEKKPVITTQNGQKYSLRWEKPS